MTYHISNKFLKKQKGFTSKFQYFPFTVSSSTFLAGNFCVSQVYLVQLYYWLIDLNQGLKIIPGRELWKTLKNNENFDVFY